MSSPNEQTPLVELHRIYELKNERLKPHIRSICLAFDTIAYSRAYDSNDEHARFVNHPLTWTRLATRFYPYSVVFPFITTLRLALQNQELHNLWLSFSEYKVDADQCEWYAHSSISEYYIQIVSAQFVSYYENNIDTIRQIFRHAHDKLPDVWRFGRVIRNAISHGGTVNISDTKFVPVSWFGATYGPSENGRAIIGKEFDIGDIICLMVEMDQELDRLQMLQASPQTPFEASQPVDEGNNTPTHSEYNGRIQLTLLLPWDPLPWWYSWK